MKVQTKTARKRAVRPRRTTKTQQARKQRPSLSARQIATMAVAMSASTFKKKRRRRKRTLPVPPPAAGLPMDDDDVLQLPNDPPDDQIIVNESNQAEIALHAIIAQTVERFRERKANDMLFVVSSSLSRHASQRRRGSGVTHPLIREASDILSPREQYNVRPSIRFVQESIQYFVDQFRGHGLDVLADVLESDLPNQ